jgi:hypothetical protein
MSSNYFIKCIAKYNVIMKVKINLNLNDEMKVGRYVGTYIYVNR